ncbi:hypothetical protein FA95DRAFT_1504772 [Auriscalpium vulgare]|uniref:Uncharacterized protein n=1 Tax=Auriscalpium vulgare TaxID=40419 RepID=A0ACB8R4T8_9AGAM|nr:hypothetical protein FA95DRAFT_1504772 [Auriscalpium vulgare]
MPTRGDRQAPKFDNLKPRELQRYFAELRHLFTRAGIEDGHDQEKKEHAARYLDVLTADQWQNQPQYAGNATFEEFVTTIIALYPGTDEERKYTMGDLDQLVAETARRGITTIGDVGEYYRGFYAISQFLIGRQRISERDRDYTFLRGFQKGLQDRIEQRLQLKYPDHDRDGPYPMDQIVEAARYVLHGTSSTPRSAGLSVPADLADLSQPVAVKAEEPAIKVEQFAALMEKAAEQIAKAYSAGRADTIGMSNAGPQPSAYTRGPPSPMMASAARFDRPRPAPGQDGARCSFCNSPEHFIRECLVLQDYIATGRVVRNEMNQVVLKSGRPVPFGPGPIQARVDKYYRTDPSGLRADVAARVAGNATETMMLALTGPIAEIEPEPIHPFASVPDATYIPVGDASRPDKGKKPVAAYTKDTPIHSEEVAKEVYVRAMGTSVTLTQSELLSLAPEVRSQLRYTITPRRIAAPVLSSRDSPVAVLHTVVAEGEEPTKDQPAVPPCGSLVLSDPMLTLMSASVKKPAPLVVAKESLALRAVLPSVDNQAHIEAILDPASQVISMSEDVCHFLGLAYDPAITLDMLSANGSIDKSLGLACNVALKLGDITLYVQIHVIRSPAYDILLGRPFDVLTGSIVRNFVDERQTITITDPNTQATVTVPTVERGSRRIVQSAGERRDFRF